LVQIESEKNQWEEEKKRIANLEKIQFDKIKLDVGGEKFSTSKSTLCSSFEPNSFFSSMFSGRHSLHKDSEDYYFIDRDGRHFRYILNYLRDPLNFVMPTEPEVKQELLVEADYYMLERFSKIANSKEAPKFSVKYDLAKLSNVILINDTLSASSVPAVSTYGNAIGSPGISSGTLYWEVRIDSQLGRGHVRVGIADDTFPYQTNTFLGSGIHSISIGPGDVIQGFESLEYSSAWGTSGDEIGLLLDMDKQQLTFSRNKKLVKTVKIPTKGPWYPAFNVHCNQDKLTILPISV